MRGGASMAVRRAKKKVKKRTAKRKPKKKKTVKKKAAKKKAVKKKTAKKKAAKKTIKRRVVAKAKPGVRPKPKYTCVLCGVEVAVSKEGLGISRLMCCGHPMRKK
jgi:hypothetical protein